MTREQKEAVIEQLNMEKQSNGTRIDMDTISDKELDELEREGKIKDEWDRFYDNPVCPECGSENVISI